MRSMFDKIFIEKNTLEMPVEMSVAVNNDDNNFASSLFRILCEIVFHSFDASVFFFRSCIP